MRRGERMSDEQRAAVSEGLRAYWRDVREGRRPKPSGTRGHRLSDEHRARLRAASLAYGARVRAGEVEHGTTKGRPQTPEHVERRAAALRGRRLSEAHRRAISEGMLARALAALARTPT